MKISAGFRTQTGAATFATLRSLLSTARKQGWNIRQTISTTTSALIHAIAGNTAQVVEIPIPATK